MHPAWQHETFRVDCISHSLRKHDWSTQPWTGIALPGVCLWLTPWRHQCGQHCIISGFSLCHSMLKFHRNKEFLCKVVSLHSREESLERGLERFPGRRCQSLLDLKSPTSQVLILMGLTVLIHRNSSRKSQVQLLSTSHSTFLLIFFNLSIHKAIAITFCL